MIQKTTLYFFLLIFFVVGGLVGLAIYKSMAPSPYDDFARCLTEKGASMYGAWWCPHCTNQKVLFGNAFQYLNYIECSKPGSKDTLPICIDDGIKSFPAWKFNDGTILSGEQTLDVLSARTSCDLPVIE